jgi:hypothetical protein
VVEHTEKSVPADAAEGGNVTITIIVSVFVGQLLPVTDQTKTLFPLSKLVICELELLAFAIDHMVLCSSANTMQQMNLGQMNITIYQIFLTLLLQHII